MKMKDCRSEYMRRPFRHTQHFMLILLIIIILKLIVIIIIIKIKTMLVLE